MLFDSPSKAQPVYIGNDLDSPIPITINGSGGGPFGPPLSTPLPAPSALSEGYLSQITTPTDLIYATAGPKVVQMAVAGGPVATVTLPAPATEGNLLVLYAQAWNAAPPVPAGFEILQASSFPVSYRVATGGEQQYSFDVANNAPTAALWEISGGLVPGLVDLYFGDSGGVGLQLTPVDFCLPIAASSALYFSPSAPAVALSEQPGSAQAAATWTQEFTSAYDSAASIPVGGAMALGYSQPSPVAGTSRGVEVTTLAGDYNSILLFIRPGVEAPGYTRIWELGMQAATSDVAKVVRTDTGQVIGSSFGGQPRKIDYQPTGLLIPNTAQLVASTTEGDPADFWATFDSI